MSTAALQTLITAFQSDPSAYGLSSPGQQTVNVGTAVESRDGDKMRDAWIKAVANFSDLDTRLTNLAAYVGSLGNAASRNMGTTPGTVADGGNLTNEINRAQAAEALLAPIASPTFTGTPTAPTPPQGTNTTQLATTEFVTAGLTAAGAATNAVLYVTQSLTSAQQLQTRQNISAVASGDTITLGNGSTATTPAAGDSTNNVATTAFATGAITNYANTVSSTYAPLAAMQGHSLIINGFHNVSQQYGATSTAVAANSSNNYATDQWIVSATGTWAGTFQQVQSPFPSQPDIPNGLQLSVTTAEATLAAGDSIRIDQPLEGTNLARLLYGTANAKSVTLAFMVRPNITLTGYVSLVSYNSSGTPIRSYAQKYTASANTDNFIYLTIPGDTAQALLTTSAMSMKVRWSFGNGSTYQGTAGAWSGSNIMSGSDVTNLAATAGNSVILSGAVMFPGTIPISQSVLPLLARRYDDELRLCQRYWYSSGGRWDGYATSGVGYSAYNKFPVSMRISPTISYSSVSGTAFPSQAPTVYTVNSNDVWSGLAANASGAGSFTFTITANARM